MCVCTVKDKTFRGRSSGRYIYYWGVVQERDVYVYESFSSNRR